MMSLWFLFQRRRDPRRLIYGAPRERVYLVLGLLCAALIASLTVLDGLIMAWLRG